MKVKFPILALLCSTLVVAGFGLLQGRPAAAEEDLDEGVQARCWLREQCEEDFRGIWGRMQSERYQATGAIRDDDWSVNNCRPLGPESKPTARCFVGNPDIPLQIGIPGVTKRFCSVYTLGEPPTTCNSDAECASAKKGKCRPGIEGGFPGYMEKFYTFFVAALAVFAVTLITWGGFKRIMAAGSAERLKDANDVIFKAIIGLALALLSYTLLNLINPRLVSLTVPMIEKVRPEFYGFCPTYDEAKISYESGYQYYRCQGGTEPDTLCTTNEQCDGGGLCSTSETLDNPPGETCGKQLVLNGRNCTGIECTSRDQGCFEKEEGTKEYGCSNVMFKGKIVQGNEVELNYIDLQMVCNNGSVVGINDIARGRPGCAVSKPFGSIEDSIDVEDEGAYAIQECYDNAIQKQPVRASACAAVGGMKGFALMVEVEAGGCLLGGVCGGADDWFAVDARTCNSYTTKRIYAPPSEEPDNDDPKAASLDQLNYALVSADQLFKPEQVFDAAGRVKPITCDLALTRSEFYDR